MAPLGHLLSHCWVVNRACRVAYLFVEAWWRLATEPKRSFFKPVNKERHFLRKLSWSFADSTGNLTTCSGNGTYLIGEMRHFSGEGERREVSFHHHRLTWRATPNMGSWHTTFSHQTYGSGLSREKHGGAMRLPPLGLQKWPSDVYIHRPETSATTGPVEYNNQWIFTLKGKWVLFSPCWKQYIIWKNFLKTPHHDSFTIWPGPSVEELIHSWLQQSPRNAYIIMQKTGGLDWCLFCRIIITLLLKNSWNNWKTYLTINGIYYLIQQLLGPKKA